MTNSQNPVFDSTAFSANLRATGLPLVSGAGIFMKPIPLTQGKFVQVDDEDYDFLMQWKWYALKSNSTFYAVRNQWNATTRKQTQIKMHRVIMKTNPGLEVDHKDHDGLNNQKHNLRNCTGAQNRAHRKSYKNSTSKYLGVHKQIDRRRKNYIRYVAQICKNNKRMIVGIYKTENEAAIAYNKAAAEIHGEFATLNILKP